MRIAVISFGRGINASESPDSMERFRPAQGLKLPVRLGRVAGQGTGHRRLTHVLTSGASGEKVHFARSCLTNLNKAITDYQERLGLTGTNAHKHIGFVNLRNGCSRSRLPEVARKVDAWARAKGFDAVIWNDLPTKGVRFGANSTGREVMPLLRADPILLRNTQRYLESLPGSPNALQRDILAMEDGYELSLVADFEQRDRMKQTDVSPSRWFHRDYGTWGPQARRFPAPTIPAHLNPLRWKQDRILAVAKKYTGLKYKRSDGKRGHFPARGCGLDCSNFVSWVFNYGLGIKFSSNADLLAITDPRQRNYVPEAGRFLRPGEALRKGDIIVLDGDPKHVVIYIDENHVIDSTSGRREGVGIRDMRQRGNRWYQPKASNPRFIGVRRPVE